MTSSSALCCQVSSTNTLCNHRGYDYSCVTSLKLLYCRNGGPSEVEMADIKLPLLKDDKMAMEEDQESSDSSIQIDNESNSPQFSLLIR